MGSVAVGSNRFNNLFELLCKEATGSLRSNGVSSKNELCDMEFQTIEYTCSICSNGLKILHCAWLCRWSFDTMIFDQYPFLMSSWNIWQCMFVCSAQYTHLCFPWEYCTECEIGTRAFGPIIAFGLSLFTHQCTMKGGCCLCRHWVLHLYTVGWLFFCGY